MNEKILEVANLSKSYGKKQVFENLNFEIYAGEILGFIGPNGVGKSTLINIICGLCEPTLGQVFINGYSVDTEFKKAAQYLGAVVENGNMYPFMTGMQNLEYYAGLCKNIKKYDIEKIVKMLKMDTYINNKVKTYSFGMRQRLNLAQALLNQPKLLVLDEPANGLDANGIIELRQILKVLARKYNMAILMSSHILSEVEQTCDTVAIFDKGAILEMRTLTDTKANAKDKFIQIMVDYPNYAAKILSVKYGVKTEIVDNSVIIPYMPDYLPDLVAGLKAHDVRVLNTETVTKSLEDFYLNTITQNNNTDNFVE